MRAYVRGIFEQLGPDREAVLRERAVTDADRDRRL
jgi:hypothetical protein